MTGPAGPQRIILLIIPHLPLRSLYEKKYAFL